MLTKTCTRSSYKPWLDSIPIINPATSSTGNINSLPQHGLYSQVGSPSPSMTDIAGDEDYDNNNNSYEASQHQDGTQKVDPKESFGLGDVSSVSMDGARMPKKRKRCGKCSGCTTVGNCGQCPPCNSIRTHQVCRQRRCTNLMMETVTSPGNKRSRSNAQKLQQMVSNGQNGGKPPVGPPPSYGGSVMAQPQRNLGATVGRMPTQYGGLLPVARPTNMQVSGYTSSQPSTTTSDSLTTTTTGNFDFLSPLTIPASLAGDTQTGGGAGLDCNALSEGLESLKYSTLEFPGIKGKVTEAFREFKEVPSTANQNQASSSSVASQENVHSTSVNFTFPLLQGQLLKVTGDGTVQPVSSKIPSQSTNSNIGMSKTGNTPQIVGVIKFNVGSSGIPLTVATSSNSSNCSKIVNNQNLNVISSNGPILITHQPMIPNVLYQSQVFNP
ncbi:uncharacterized protein [Periplaneta americana]|uniref:uncharacterized protein isoform X2 n=1 Tax=Periplaneta americana TaxID=6978 RepID=UPI0037E94D79